MKIFTTQSTILDDLTVGVENNRLTDLICSASLPRSGYMREVQDELTRAVFRQLNEYFDGSLRSFDMPLAYTGTPFQVAVWEAVMTIPYGETRSYLDIAIQVGNPRAARAVGNANHECPISIVIPCHRVIASDGSIGGYGEGGLRTKQFLLDLERVTGC